LFDRIVLDEIRMKEDGDLYPNAIKKGWAVLKIHKSAKIHQKWTRRWFVLLQTELLYFKKPGDVTPLESIPVERMNLLTVKDFEDRMASDKKFCLQLVLANPVEDSSKPLPVRSLRDTKNEIVFTMSLPSERELGSWTKVLKRSIDKLQIASIRRRRSSF